MKKLTLLLLAFLFFAGCKKEDPNRRLTPWKIGTQVRLKEPDAVMKEPMYIVGYHDTSHVDFIQYKVRDANFNKLKYDYTVINRQLKWVADPTEAVLASLPFK